jgi:predicted CoA-binding protein
MVNVVDSVKEVANTIEIVDAVRQKKKLCHHIRGRMDCPYATLSKLDDAGARKDPID